MNGFIASARPPIATAEPVVVNDGWFPDMNPVHVRAACRLDATVTLERLRPALIDAMLSVNAELADWAQEQRTRWGYAALEDVPALRADGKSAKVLHYERAVHYCLQADLAELYRNISTTPNSTNKADRIMEELVVHIGEHRRKQRWAISDLLSKSRCTVELL